MLFSYIMEDLSIILSLLLVVIFLSNCTYMFYRRANIDKIENYDDNENTENEDNSENTENEDNSENTENTENTENSQRPSRKKLTDEQIEAMNVMYNMIKNSNININNPCKLINEFCFQRFQNENCNDDRYFNSIECTTSSKFCEDPSIMKQCASEEEMITWMSSLSGEDKKKFFEAMSVINPEIKALMQ